MSFFCISNKQAQAQAQAQPQQPADQKQLVPLSSSSSTPTPTPPVPRPPHSSSFQKYLLEPLPDPSTSRQRKCLVLDLDETLVHSSFKVSMQRTLGWVRLCRGVTWHREHCR